MPGRRYDWDASTAVLRRLAELVLEDDTLLRWPIPPFSECSELFASELARREHAREESYDNDLWYDEPCDREDDDLVELTFRLPPGELGTQRRLSSAAGLSYEALLQLSEEALRTSPSRGRWLRAMP